MGIIAATKVGDNHVVQKMASIWNYNIFLILKQISQ